MPSVFISTQGIDLSEIDDPAFYADMSALFVDENGERDTSAAGIIRRRGHGSGDAEEKPYSLNLKEEYSILGMQKASKWALLNTFMGGTQRLTDKIAMDLGRAIGIRYTPEGTFVNVYVNGVYHGFYLLAQRVNANGGSVRIHNLRKDNKKLNKDYYTELEGQIEKKGEGLYDRSKATPYDLTQNGSSQEQAASEDGAEPESRSASLPVSPGNITGGYLLEFDHYKTGEYFSCGDSWVSVRAPKETTTEEFTYISDYVNMLDRAISDEDGVDPETGVSYTDYLDLESWVRDYQMKNFFVEADTDWSSFYMYKERNDTHLYAGPVWDYELSMGHGYQENENHPEISQRALWIRDYTSGWLHQLGEKPEFMQLVYEEYAGEFAPAVRDYLENDFERVTANLIPSLTMNAVRWDAAMPDYEAEIEGCREWLEKRTAFLSDYYREPDQYCKVNFQFRWGTYTAYVRKDSELGFLPTWKYHESSAIRENDYSFLDHWVDEEGKLVSERNRITEDVTFYSRYNVKIDDQEIETDQLNSLLFVLKTIPELKCNAVVLIGPKAWETEDEAANDLLLSLAERSGIASDGRENVLQSLQGKTLALVVEDGRIGLMTGADSAGASVTVNGATYSIFFSDDQFAVYRDGEESIIDSLDDFPAEEGARLYVADARDWEVIKYERSVEQP